MPKELIICLGPICSGKTTWSKERIREDPKSYRFCFDEYLYMCTGRGEYNPIVADSIPSPIQSLLVRPGVDTVIVDGFPLNYGLLKRTINFRLTANAKATIRLFDVRFDEAIRRNVRRKSTIGKFIEVEEMKNYLTKYKEFIKSPDFKLVADGTNVIVSEFHDANMHMIT